MNETREVNEVMGKRVIELMTARYGPPEPKSVTENGDGTVTITEGWPGTNFEIRRTVLEEKT